MDGTDRLRAYLDANPEVHDPDALHAAWLSVQRDAPTLPGLTALIVAKDRMSADRATAMVRAGVPWLLALPLVGSYARIGWMLDMSDEGHAPRRDVLAMLPVEWPISDPDDTDPRFLAAWSEAWVNNGRRVATDGDPLPPGRVLTIYRGQGDADRLGIAWSLSEDVARRFAMGASVRVPGGVPDPVILHARVHRRQVLAYLTGRGESEVIVNPYTLTGRSR